MQIIKEGSVPSREEYFLDATVVCEKRDEHDRQSHCGAKLQFDQEDLVPRYWQASHSYKYYFVVVCTRCACDCHITLPKAVHRELMDKAMRKKASFDGFNG